MSDITNDIIRKITRYAQQIGELYNRGANKIEEYRHLANVFGKCSSIEQAHRMSAMVFGVDTPLHLRTLPQRDTDSIDSGVYEEAPAYYALEPRTRIATVKTQRKPAVDYRLEKEMQRQEILRKQAHTQELLAAYIHQNQIDFAQIEYLEAAIRKIFLSWLSRGMASASHRGKTEWGRQYWIDDSDKTVVKICCSDGDFYMPSFRILFEEENQ